MEFRKRQTGFWKKSASLPRDLHKTERRHPGDLRTGRIAQCQFPHISRKRFPIAFLLHTDEIAEDDSADFTGGEADA